ncbi:MAG: hypothetical protein ABL898_15235 [Hyphomicrobiaceae bacterium]
MTERFANSRHPQRRALARRGAMLAVSALLAVMALSHESLAQGTAGTLVDNAQRQSSSYVTPFPPQDTYRLQIYGDWMSEGLISGLTEALQGDNRVQVIRKHRALVALIKPEHEDDVKVEEASRDQLQIGVLFFGISDRVNFRLGTQLLKLGSEPWQNEYGRRVDRLVKALKRRGIALYMVGQPPLRREDANEDAKMINEILREKAFVNGVRFVEIAPEFLDENGDFTQFGPDFKGERQKLREGDGISMTWQGHRKVAALIEREMRRDLAIARAERAVPLVGGELEQRRINPDKPLPTAAKAIVPAKGDARQAATAAVATPAPVASAAAPDQVEEIARVSFRSLNAQGRDETTTLDIVRPAISAQMLALLARKDVTQTAQRNFEIVGAELGDGTTLSMIVSPLPSAQPATAAQTAGTAQLTVYNAVWVRGDRLPPKPGRADDFSWPPSGALPYQAPAEAAPKSAAPIVAPQRAPQATSPALKNQPEPNVPRVRPQRG